MFDENGKPTPEGQIIISDGGFLAKMVYESEASLRNMSINQDPNKKAPIIIQNPHTKTKFEVKQIIDDQAFGLQMTHFKELDSNKNYIMYAGTDLLSFNDIQNNLIILEKQKNFQTLVAERHTKQIIENIKKENPDALNIVGGHSLGGGTAQEQTATNKDIDLGLGFNAFGAGNVIKARYDYDPKLAAAQEGKMFNFSTYGDPVTHVNEQYGQNMLINEKISYLDLLDPSFWLGRHGANAVNNGVNKADGYIKINNDKISDLIDTFYGFYVAAKNGYDLANFLFEKINGNALFKNLVANLGDFVVNGHSLSGANINISLYDPIALDLNNNGKIDTITLENGVFFDHNGDEIAFKSSWISGDDGILARDINGDKEINSGAELFGNFTQLKNGELAKNGFEALKDLDSDDNGVFDESDKTFNEILVWQDYNSNGKAESGELKSLSEHGIKSINLEFLDDNTALDKDNKQILVGSFSINDSDNALASDIDFSVNTVEREMAESAGLIKGTGFVRDLADALVLSANSDNALVDIYNEFASLDEKQKQLKILPKLVNEWAKTSKHYKSINDDESFLQQNKINIVNIRSDVSTSYVNSLKSNDKVAINQELENTNNANIQSLTPSGLNKLLNQRNIDQDLLKQVLELKDKYSVLQAFSGKDIQTLYYDSNEDLLNIKANITKSYQAILDYTYKSSLMQTRLKEYANDLKLLVDTNMQDDSLKTLIDYSDALNKLENKAKDNLKEAFIDLIEFSDVFDDLSSLKQANDLVSKLINQAIDNNEIYYVLDLLDNNDILVNNLKDVLITKTINNENIYDLDAITSKLNVNIIINKDENNKLQGSNKDDIIISSKTNEDLVGNGGNDVYVFSKDWGKDIVYSYHNNKQSISLRFNDIKLNEIELSTNKNNDLIITDIANSNNEIFIQNALYDGEYKIDKIILEDISLEFEEIKLLAYNKIEQGV